MTAAVTVVGWVVVWAAVAAGGLAALWGLLKLANRRIGRLLNVSAPRNPRVRAAAASIIACSRRAVSVNLPGDAVLIIALGHDFTQQREVAEAIQSVIGDGRKTLTRIKREEPGQ